MLNIYKVSGLPKIGASTGKYQYWTGGTTDYTNTVAFNNLLTAVNAKWQLIEKNMGDKVSLYNSIDLDIICLEALALNVKDAELYPLDFLGMVIAEMQFEGILNNDSTDDSVRSDNLDKLISDFESRLNDNLTGSYSAEFYEWWNTQVIPNCFNSNTTDEIERLNSFFQNGKIGSESVEIPNPENYTSMADYIKACGPCFLYMFIPASDTGKYNRMITWKRQKELSVTYAYIKNNVGGMYSDAAIKSLFAQGIIDYWGMTPQQKLQQVLDNGGKVGVVVVDDILYVIGAIISLLITLLSLIMNVYKLTYTVADEAEQYVPDDNDLTSLMQTEQTEKKTNTAGIGSNTGFFAAAALLIFAYMFNRGNN